jgi:hypothetical protein
MNVDKKIASSETTNMRKVNGNGSILQLAGITAKLLNAIHRPNQAT